MAIAITKTLQTVEYQLYVKSSVIYLASPMVVMKEEVYQSEGHYTDGFVPMIVKTEVINHAATANAFGASYASLAGITVAEEYLVANVAWYSGGVVE